MMRKVICGLLITLLTLQASYAQDAVSEVEVARFDMSVAALEFLATDSATFKNLKVSKCLQCKTYQDLNAFIATNRLTGADKFLSSWQKIPSDSTDFLSATFFANQIKRSITEGPPNRVRRKQFSSYKDLESKLNTIVARFQNEKTVQDSEIKKEEVAESVPAEGLGVLPFVAAGVVFLVLVIGLIKKQADVRSLKEQLRNRRRSNTDEDYYLLENAELKKKVNVLLEREKELESELIQVKKVPQLETAKADRLSEDVVPLKLDNILPTRMFARYADQGDGFTDSELLNQEDDETLFEIHNINGTQAKFSIANNPNAQKYALMNASYYLSRTCSYTNSPSGNSRIRTDVPGILRLVGKKWEIADPIQISFV